ncbi:DUF3616 domain-containing protein [Rhizobium sp. 768_B6_N1_8]|uniref:DUF3616 domain-containing protein n=1 Tax=unclassified Rhizobium TaxID=2613769 RepID=UPI003F29054D
MAQGIFTSRVLFAFVASHLVLGWAISVAASELRPTQLLNVQPALQDEKESENISGADCAVVGSKGSSCLLIGDEKRYARFFKLEGQTLVPGEELFLLPKFADADESIEFDETDAEAVAYGNGSYFLVGSHGRNKEGIVQDSRYFIYRVEVDPTTGLVEDFGSKKKASKQVKRSANLKAVILADPVLSKHEGDVPDKGGINIEGLAVSGGKLYIGFRGPLQDGKAIIGAISISDAFDNPKAKLKPYSVELGEGQGVRDIAPAEDGFLILSGPQRDTAGSAAVCFWKPDADAKPCVDIVKAGPADSKPESLTVLETESDHYKVLIMSDGAPGGAPAIYDVPR